MWPSGDVPTVDPVMGDVAARQLSLDASRGNWQPARDFLLSVEHPDDRAFYTQAVSYVDGVEGWIGEWLAADPSSTLPLLIRGAHAIYDERLKYAEDCLVEVTERDPDDPTAWMFLVLTGRARQVGVDEAQRRFLAATDRHRWHRTAHEHMLQQLCPKWGGTLEAVHAFATDTLGDMPPGNPLGALIAMAHIEHWMEVPDGQETAYIRAPHVVAELREAAEKSVWHPDYEPRPGWPGPENTFAMAFWLAGDWPAAARQFDTIGDLVTEWPWAYLGDAGRRFAAARDEVDRRVRTGTLPRGR
jgi:hypothetical protein